MGTRADFYVAHSTTDLEYLGSIGWDGYDIEGVGDAKDQQDFRQRLSKFFSERDDATLPPEPFPFPWRDSRLTDYAYVWTEEFGVVWRLGDDYPMGNSARDDYIPDDGKCDAYISMRKLAELAPAPQDDQSDEDEHGEDELKRAAVDILYIYPDMGDRSKVRMDKGSGLLILGG